MEQAVVNATPDETHDFLRIENLGIDIIPPAPFSERVFNVPDTLHGMGDEVPAICTSALHKTISRRADDLPGVIMTTADLREQKNTTEKLVTAWIVHAFEHGDDNRKYEAIEVIKYTPEADRTGLIEQVLTSPDSSYFLKCAAINVIRDAPEADRTRLIEQVLTASDSSDDLKREVIYAIEHAPEADRTRLIEQVLTASDSSDDLKREVIYAIEHAPETDRTGLIEQVLTSPDSSDFLKFRAVDAIRYAPEADRTRLIEQVLTMLNKIDYLEDAAISAIQHAPEVDRTGLQKHVTAWITHAFEHGSDKRKRKAIYAIRYVPEADRTKLIESMLTASDSSDDLKCEAIYAIKHAPEADRTRLIEQVLTASGGSDYSKYAAINAIKYAPEADRTRLIEQAFAAFGSSDFLKRVIVDAIQYVSEADQLRFYRLVSSSEPKPTPTEPLTKSPLHDVAQPNEVVTFHKTGSETYILPEEHEASVRLISPQSAAAWLHANNSWDKWRDAGFEYVPIEPILAVKPVSDTHTVAMTTTNLRGRSFDYATEYFGHFAKRLQQSKDDIKQTLVEIGVWHGHLHDKNFVVVPYVQQDGEVDYSKCPRLYVIDFDRALIVKK